MTVTKAIEILTCFQNTLDPIHCPHLYPAFALVIGVLHSLSPHDVAMIDRLYATPPCSPMEAGYVPLFK